MYIKLLCSANTKLFACRVRRLSVTYKNCATSGVLYLCMNWLHPRVRLMSRCLNLVWKHVNTLQQAKVAIFMLNQWLIYIFM